MKYAFYILSLFLVLLLNCDKNTGPLHPIIEEKVIFSNTIEDYRFLNNQFFFADSFYIATYESSFDPQTMEWIPPDGGLHRINKLEVWISSHPTDAYSVLGIAAVNPDTINRDSIQYYNEIKGEIIRTYFKQLVYPKDYLFDSEKGVIRINKSLETTHIIGVSYQTEGGLKRGIFGEEISKEQSHAVFKLVKPADLRPNYPSWELEMRNVYDIGIRNIPEKNLRIVVTYTDNAADLRIQPSNRKSFNYLLGLDRLNKDGEFIEGGDGYIDTRNENIFDLKNGLLIFPSPTPFSPP
ncbi:MAG: hypothetical protein P8184_21950, partial [Calditrichia bacterium]